jgi:hypothetical protein
MVGLRPATRLVNVPSRWLLSRRPGMTRSRAQRPSRSPTHRRATPRRRARSGAVAHRRDAGAGAGAGPPARRRRAPPWRVVVHAAGAESLRPHQRSTRICAGQCLRACACGAAARIDGARARPCHNTHRWRVIEAEGSPSFSLSLSLSLALTSILTSTQMHARAHRDTHKHAHALVPPATAAQHRTARTQVPPPAAGAGPGRRLAAAAPPPVQAQPTLAPSTFYLTFLPVPTRLTNPAIFDQFCHVSSVTFQQHARAHACTGTLHLPPARVRATPATPCPVRARM